MKGYKGFDENLRCRGKQYEVGKIHHQEGKIELCNTGIHFCKTLNAVFQYYPDGRYCEVEATGTVIEGYNKSVSSDLFIIRELDLIEVNRCRYGNGYGSSDHYCCGDGYGDGLGDGYVGHYCCGDGYGGGFGYGYGYDYVGGSGRGDGHGNVDGIQNILLFTED